MILITGAAGKTGRAVIQALSALGASVRAFVRREEQIPILEALWVDDVWVGDLLNSQAVEQSLQGVRAVYHIPPNVSPYEFRIGQLIISAARSSGVEQFVFHSVMHPQTESMPHHWQKLRVEESLFESGLPFTILQPTAYMQNLLAHWDRIIDQGIYPVPYSKEARSCLVDLNDVAEVAAKVLTEPGHIGATYELVGSRALSQTEIAQILSEGLNRAVDVQEISVDVWEAGVREAGMGEYQIATLKKMFAYYDRFGFQGNSNVLAWLLGREPTSYEAFVQRYVNFEV
ncbi:MAG: NmrA family NAD(P)-binding protein [Anaerolineales bacterium]|nr:NmrA family NAD(P)-binding protein [Anaerolineales bacterium]